MGLERLLCGALLSTQSPRSMSGVLHRAAALYSRMVVHSSRHREPAARLLSSSTQPSRDVTLFQHDRTRFFRLLSLFCGGQLLFWTYLGHFAYTGLRDTGRGTAKTSTTTTSSTTTTTTTTMGLAGIWSFEMNLGSNSWRFGFTLGCLAMGAGVVGLGVLFCRRSVSQVVLHQGGRMVTVSTQSPLGAGRGRRITVPLSQVACHAHRHESPSFIPLRVKGHKFYFLLDKEGTVNNARLFDTTVGAYRPV
ncbi:transmembrane protein 223 [Sebastes umbrosus]|uniref:transmembrane protein 223 n=1 Tax=Sebastes umbrosus TaxID=72105 RepID=UPI00189DCCB0|nr:transmembrane protein 223 [Sebastes umbrosus]